jgi:hypothetical protein
MNLERKPNASSVLASLPEAQRNLIESWLFDQFLSQREVVDKAQKELGVKLNQTSVSRFCQDIAVKRNLIFIFKSADLTLELLEVFKKCPDKIYDSMLNMAGQIIFTILATAKPGEPPDIEPLHNTIKLMIAARKDGRADRQFLFEREKWEIDVARLCAQHHSDLQAIAADDSLDEGDRLQAIRRRLFGDDSTDTPAPQTQVEHE